MNQTELQVIILSIWAIVGVISAIGISVNDKGFLTLKDIIVALIVGSTLGGVVLLIWFLISTNFDKVIWRKK